MTDATAAAASLARKRRTHSGHRSYTTRLLNQATDTMEADPLDTEELLLIRDMLVEKVETLKGLDGEIVELVSEGELKEEIERADEYKQGVYRILAKT
jgi:hypothetical protein